MTRKNHAYVTGTGGSYRVVISPEARDFMGIKDVIVATDGERWALPVGFSKYRPAQAMANAINFYLISHGMENGK